jgi:hypothetical protein
MPAVIDTHSLDANELPTVWSPVQWELTEDERVQELENQATASMLWAADVPEAILRLLLSETEIERAYAAPQGFDPAQQGDWDEAVLTFQYRQPIRLIQCVHEPDRLYIEYKFGDLGYWAFEIGPEEVKIKRL